MLNLWTKIEKRGISKSFIKDFHSTIKKSDDFKNGFLDVKHTSTQYRPIAACFSFIIFSSAIYACCRNFLSTAVWGFRCRNFLNPVLCFSLEGLFRSASVACCLMAPLGLPFTTSSLQPEAHSTGTYMFHLRPQPHARHQNALRSYHCLSC